MASPRLTAIAWQEEYKKGDPAIAELYAAPCFDWRASWKAASEAAPLRSDEVAEWRAFLSTYADPANTERLALLTQPGTTVVVTGQQAGALMGPLYTIYKALAAKHWAERVERETGKPCIPVFWIASDDHDLEEIRRGTWMTKEGTLVESDFTAADTADSSVFRQPIDAEKAVAFLQQFLADTTPTEFRDEVSKLLTSSLAGEQNFESHFLHLAVPLLLSLGIHPIVPRLEFLRRRASTIIAHEAEHFAQSNSSINSVGSRIEALGAEAPLKRPDDRLNFFMEVDDRRCRVEVHHRRYRALSSSGEVVLEMSGEEMLEAITSDPARFSPGAALRPLVQDFALPNVAYIPGPTELLYHAQLGPLYEAFNVRRPALIPRPNVFVAEGKVAKSFAKLGVDPADFLRSGKLGEFPPPESDALSRFNTDAQKLKSDIDKLLGELGDATKDTGVAKAAERLKSSFETGMEKLQERLVDHASRQDVDRRNAIEKIRTNLFPGDIPQERAVSIVSPFLINYGTNFVRRLYSSIEYEAPGFQVVTASAPAQKNEEETKPSPPRS